MLTLNEKTQEKARLLELINHAYGNDTMELECQVAPGNINFNSMTNILKRLKTHPNYTPEKEKQRLDIFFPPESKYRNIRATIKGVAAINNYCVNPTISTVLSHTDFIIKKRVEDIENRVIIGEFGLKFNLKSEVPLLVDDSIVRELIINWKTVGKSYRLKKIFSFTSIDGLFSTDISIVKSSSIATEMRIADVIDGDLIRFVKKPDSFVGSFKSWWEKVATNPNNKVYVANTSFNDNMKDIINASENYEVEVEYIKRIKSSKDKKTYILLLLESFMQHIVVLLQAAEQSIYITGKSIKSAVRNEMAGLFNASLRRLEKEKHGHSADASDNQIASDDESTDSEPKKKPKRRMYELRENDIFFGPLIVDLEAKDITPLTRDTLPNVRTNTNIQINYLVTDKADGERFLLFINKDGQAFMVGRGEQTIFSNPIKITGITLPAMANSIFDGEFVSRLATGKFAQHYYIFDAYVFHGENLMKKPFAWNKETGRHAAIKKMIDYVRTGKDITQLTERMPFQIFAKEYYPSDTIATFPANEAEPLIFQNCRKILGKINHKYGGMLEGEAHMFNYGTDGLVFLPNNLSIYQMTMDDEIDNLASDKRWLANYKWKPIDHLTIDFKVVIEKKADSHQYNYLYLNSRRYVRASLYCKFYSKLRLEDNAAILAYAINQGYDLQSLPEDLPFAPTVPFIGDVDSDGHITNNASYCLLEVDDNDVIRCENGDILVDGNTSEFSYNKSTPVDMRWYPLRNRAGKQPNALRTSYAIWEQIHNPITSNWLTTGTPDEGAKELYYSSADVARVSDPVKRFNNYVKSLVINYGLSGWSKPAVLELASGQMGDYFKYLASGAATLVGLEINADNIHNRTKGAAMRLAEFQRRSPADKKLVARTLLIQGDMSKNISSGDAATDSLNRYYLDVLYDRAEANSTKLRTLRNVGLEGFHVISCMYAIHYMFQNEGTLRGFLVNVSENLRDNGYFIGTCLDGPAVLASIPSDENKITMDEHDTTIFTIEKMEDIDYSEINTGQTVNVFFETFAKMTPEYLVNISYLETLAAEYNLKLVSSGIFTKEQKHALSADEDVADHQPILDNLLQQFSMEDSRNKSLADEIAKSPALKQWADYQRYFIFQKVVSI